MRIHVLETGRLRGNASFLRGERMTAAHRPPRPVEVPVLSFVLEHPEGLVVVDTGLRADVHVPRPLRRIAPLPLERAPGGMAALMRDRGLDPASVRTVLLTHLDWDHAGGVADFPDAEILVHRPEHAASLGRPGRIRYGSACWPAGFSPTLFDLDGGAFGPFGAARELAPGLIIVPLPGHTAGQVGLVADAGAGRPTVLFCADHILRQDWWFDDVRRGRFVGLGQFAPRVAADTGRRIARLLSAAPTVLAPWHDTATVARLDDLAAAAIADGSIRLMAS